MKEFGIITYLIYKLFYLLKFLPPQVFVEDRINSQIRMAGSSEEDKQLVTHKRVVKAERIVLVYIGIYILAILFNQHIYEHNGLRWFTLILILLRLIDIIQQNVNVTLFDAIREGEGIHADLKLKSIVRAIVLVAFAFIEVGIIFGLLYSLMQHGKLISDFPLVLGDYFYFSFITQLTIGYGEITPTGLAKLLACFQGLTGYFFSILILSRLLSSLPGVGSRLK
jgi:hypothetical protein